MAEDRKAIAKQYEAQIKALEKDIKKKKGAYKAAAQEKLAEVEAEYAEALAAFDAAQGGPKPADSKKKQKEKDKADNKKKVKIDFDPSELNGFSKKDLENECVKYGLGKKGSKEDLITKLMTFSLDNAAKSDDEEEEEEEEDEGSEDDKEMTEEEKQEAERQYKREQAIQKALRVMLKKNPDGVDVPDVISTLEGLGVKNFKPQLLGHETMEALLEDMPEYVLEFVKGDGDTPSRVMPAGSINV